MAHGKQRGYTLIELMLTLTVLSVLLGLAIPSFRDMVRNNRITAQTNEFVGSLNFARSEALKRSNPVTACASDDGATCSGDNDWSTGWVVFADVNANGLLDNAEVALQTWPAIDGGITLSATTRPFVRFGATGVSSGSETFALLKPGCTGNFAREITVGTTGRVGSAVKACP